MRRSYRNCWSAVLCCLLLSAATVMADETAVRIEAPSRAEPGSDITVTVHATHSGNNFFHFTDWIWLKAGEREIGRWEFEADSRPENENFSRQVRYRIDGPVVFTAQGNCNVHGSAGPARAEVAVSGGPAPMGTVASQSAVPPRSGRGPLAWIVLTLGIANLALCGFQVASGRRWIKVKITVHRRTGQTLLALALIHGLLALLINL